MLTGLARGGVAGGVRTWRVRRYLTVADPIAVTGERLMKDHNHSGSAPQQRWTI